MAYNNYYPQFYQAQQNQQPPMQLQQVNTSGLIPVPSETVARNYPVGFGQSVSFRDENLPFLYTKTMGFSQLEPPIFEKYRLVKEVSNSSHNEPQDDNPANTTTYLVKDDLKPIWSEIEALKKGLEDLKEGV